MLAVVTTTAVALAQTVDIPAQEINGFSSYEHDEPSMSLAPAAQILRYGDPDRLPLHSSAALVVDQNENVTLLERNANEQHPIASLTKLMTALVTLAADLPFDELIEITPADNDWLKGTGSRLRYGTVLTRYHMLLVALAASDNRAAAALARTYPGGRRAMILEMNAKALELGMWDSRFTEPTGLDDGNVSTASDLAKLIAATSDYSLIHRLSTRTEFLVTDWRADRMLVFRNTNPLLRKDLWHIALSKTGYTAAAGRCLLIETIIANRPLLIVLLNAAGKLNLYDDSYRIRDWLLTTEASLQALVSLPLP
ncbi:MAG: serine hydrolase [Acidiferrobacterales bacterium]|nr:serine hydrolase [Acidiferrobacterales bacterium]